MKVIIRPRGAGKTYEAIKYCSENNLVLIVSPNKIQHTENMIKDMLNRKEVTYPVRVLPMKEFIDNSENNRMIMHQHRGYFIDDIEYCGRIWGNGLLRGFTCNEHLDVDVRYGRFIDE